MFYTFVTQGSQGQAGSPGSPGTVGSPVRTKHIEEYSLNIVIVIESEYTK